MDIALTIKKVQAKLGLTADGIAGALTWAAIAKALDADTPAVSSASIDSRTETNIKTLSPNTQEKAREFMMALAQEGIEAKIISGTRTYEEQDKLYAQGRTAPGSIVTNARAGFSWHNHGVAFDIGIFDGAKYLPESPLYERAGTIGKSLGFEWGGDWDFEDKPHFQLNPDRFTLTQARVMHDENKRLA